MSLQRARPLLGTVVIVRLGPQALPLARQAQAVDAALERIATIGRVMSAHDPDADLGRIARAAPDSVLQVHADTVAVLRLARHWHAVSGGAYDPVRAARALIPSGRRPALGQPCTLGRLCDLDLLDDTHVALRRALPLDLGGLAKGYAVDQALAALRHHGVTEALVNAGGDLAAMGTHAWPVQVRAATGQTTAHAARHPGPSDQGARGATHPLVAATDGHAHARTAAPALRRQAAPTTLRAGALATSVAGPDNLDMVATRRGTRGFAARQCTVQARDCATADALTKLGLQAKAPALALRRLARAHGAKVWLA